MADSSTSAEEEERKPDVRYTAGPVRIVNVPRAPDGAKRIWLRFVGNNPKWGCQAQQEIRAIYDRSLGSTFVTYAQKVGVSSYTHLRFVYDGKRLDATMSAHHYEMEDGDQIDVFQEQLGGCGEEI